MKDPQMFQFPNEAMLLKRQNAAVLHFLPVVSPRVAISACLLLS